jgi:hypothetical protein
LEKEKLEEALLIKMFMPKRYQRYYYYFLKINKIIFKIILRAITMKRGSLGPRPLRFGK